VGAQEQVNEMDAQIVNLVSENLALKREGEGLKADLAAVKAELAEVREKAKAEGGEHSEGKKD
jgi:regulator of replication initiation timing